MIKDFLNRPLKVGDLVLVSNSRLSEKNHFIVGLVVDSNGIYTGDNVLSHKCNECYLINNLDDKELQLKKELGDKYNLLINKKNKFKKMKQTPGGIYKKSNGEFYLFIGKYKLSPNYAMCVEKVDTGYMYVQLSEDEVNKALLEKKVNVSELLYNNLSSLDGIKHISYGYKDVLPHVIFLRGNATVCAYLESISLDGFLNVNKDINVAKYMSSLNIKYSYSKYISPYIDSINDLTFVCCES